MVFYGIFQRKRPDRAQLTTSPRWTCRDSRTFWREKNSETTTTLSAPLVGRLGWATWASARSVRSWLGPYRAHSCRISHMVILTHISLASYFWDIGKQYRPRWDAAELGVSSGSTLFAYRNFYKKWNKSEINTPYSPKIWKWTRPNDDNGKVHSTNVG